MPRQRWTRYWRRTRPFTTRRKLWRCNHPRQQTKGLLQLRPWMHYHRRYSDSEALRRINDYWGLLAYNGYSKNLFLITVRNILYIRTVIQYITVRFDWYIYMWYFAEVINAPSNKWSLACNGYCTFLLVQYRHLSTTWERTSYLTATAKWFSSLFSNVFTLFHTLVFCQMLSCCASASAPKTQYSVLSFTSRDIVRKCYNCSEPSWPRSACFNEYLYDIQLTEKAQMGSRAATKTYGSFRESMQAGGAALSQHYETARDAGKENLAAAQAAGKQHVAAAQEQYAAYMEAHPKTAERVSVMS